jgi:hypothetical protein
LLFKKTKTPIYGGFKRMKRLELSTFCMASGSRVRVGCAQTRTVMRKEPT